MPATETRLCRDYAVFTRNFFKSGLPIIQPKQVRLQAIVGHVNVDIAILIEIASGYAPSRIFPLASLDAKALSTFVDKNQQRPFTSFIASHVKVYETIVVQIGPYSTSGPDSRKVR